MKLDKRVIECCALGAVLVVVALATSVSTPNVPTGSNEVSENTTIETQSVSSDETANAGVSLDMNEKEPSQGDALGEQTPSIEAVQTDVVASELNKVDWSKRVMAKVDESVNIRAEASVDSKLLGKLYKGCAADIVESGEEWTKIKSGSVEGFIRNDFLAFGEEAIELAKTDGKIVATILTDTLRVRKEPSAESAVMGLVGKGEKLKVVDSEGYDGFVAIEFGEDTAYVAAEFASVDFILGEALTIEEERAKLAAEAAEKARKEAAKNPVYTLSPTIAATVDEHALLAALIYCEAGSQCYEGQLAVGAVVMNRVRSPRYPNTIRDVIYQSGQFTPALNGKLERVLQSGLYRGSCEQAATEALAGISNVGDAIGFKFASTGIQGIVIEGVVFF